MTRDAVLARTMVELADNLVEDFDLVDLLTTLSVRCVEVLDIAAAGVMLAAAGEDLRAMTASTEAMFLVELFELQAQDGPCLDAYRTGQPVVNQDLTTAEDRWPLFTPMALGSGFRAVDAIPMRLRGQVIGALNLFRTEVGSLTAGDVETAQALADIATIAILQHRIAVEAQVLNDQLTRALSSRILIEQAKGMISERVRVSMEQAFTQLRQHARDHNLHLADLAREIVAGAVDPASLGRLRS